MYRCVCVNLGLEFIIVFRQANGEHGVGRVYGLGFTAKPAASMVSEGLRAQDRTSSPHELSVIAQCCCRRSHNITWYGSGFRD